METTKLHNPIHETEFYITGFMTIPFYIVSGSEPKLKTVGQFLIYVTIRTTIGHIYLSTVKKLIMKGFTLRRISEISIF